jgi:hypothetical protein
VSGAGLVPVGRGVPGVLGRVGDEAVAGGLSGAGVVPLLVAAGGAGAVGSGPVSGVIGVTAAQSSALGRV